MTVPAEQNIRPESWVVLELSDNNETIRKILSGWRGGYLDSDSWRFSSRIVKESEKDGELFFETESGSTYHCLLSTEGLTTPTNGVYNNLKNIKGLKVKMLYYGDPT